MEVVVDKRNEFQISSCEVDRTIMEMKKKRKLQDEQLGLPLPKHKFGDRSFNNDSWLHHHLTNNGAKKYKAYDDDYDDDSEQGSNSLVDECDSSMSTTSAESKLDSGNAKTCPSDWLRTLTNDFNNSVDGGGSCSSSIIIDPQNSKLKLHQSYPDDDVHEFGNLMEYGCLEQQGMEVANNNHRYVLSSGRWTTDQEKAVTERKREDKLTIDKEFEQYFSMLML